MSALRQAGGRERVVGERLRGGGGEGGERDLTDSVTFVSDHLSPRASHD